MKILANAFYVFGFSVKTMYS